VDWRLFIQLAATFVVTALGWWAAYYFSKRRDVENDRRKLRTEYLLDAYRRLQDSTHRKGNEEKYWATLESAISDIQLLGTARQAKLAAQFALDMQQSNIGYLDELLLDLRNSLRHGLKLEQLSEGSRVMRFYNKEGENPVVINERSSIDAAEEKQK
jgi:hypothetical protein